MNKIDKTRRNGFEGGCIIIARAIGQSDGTQPTNIVNEIVFSLRVKQYKTVYFVWEKKNQNRNIGGRHKQSGHKHK